MNKLQALVCLMVLVGLADSISAYDSPCHPPFLSSSRPFSFENSPASLFLSQERAAFAFEIAAGIYLRYLFPWPSIQGYWHFVDKNLGGYVALISTYQYTIRQKVHFTNLDGEDLKKGYLWNTQLIYTVRSGLSYRLSPIFVFGLSSDINYGFDRFDLCLAGDPDYWLPDEGRHNQRSALAFSFGLGSAISS